MKSALEILCEKLHLMKLNLARSAGIRGGMKVIDIGCGQGTFTVCVAELVGETGKVTAIDISDEDFDARAVNPKPLGFIGVASSGDSDLEGF